MKIFFHDIELKIQKDKPAYFFPFEGDTNPVVHKKLLIISDIYNVFSVNFCFFQSFLGKTLY